MGASHDRRKRSPPTRKSALWPCLVTAPLTAAAGWAFAQLQPLVDPRAASAVLSSPVLGGIAAVVAALIGGASALMIARRDRRQREWSQRKDQWWARARWALDLLVEDDLRRRLVGYGVLSALAGQEWAGIHEADLVESATREAAGAYSGMGAPSIPSSETC